MKKHFLTLALFCTMAPLAGQIHGGLGLTVAYRNGNVTNKGMNETILESNAALGDRLLEPFAFRGPRGGYTIAGDVYYGMMYGGIRVSKAWNSITATEKSGRQYEFKLSEFHFVPNLGFGFQRNFFHFQFNYGLVFGTNRIKSYTQYKGSEQRFVSRNYDNIFFGQSLRVETSAFFVFFAVERVFAPKEGSSDTGPLIDNYINVSNYGVNSTFSGMRYEIGLRFHFADEL